MTDPSRRDPGWEGLGIGWAVVSTLIAGFVTLGGLGYLADHLFHTGKVLTSIGFVFGAAAGIYLVYLRYGRGDGGEV
jgi:F0F1-type ATP synthase assembly protein I